MKILEHARHSRFLRHNSIFFFGAAAVGALNYLYYPIMGRMLSTVSFGEVQTVISLFLQITILLSVLGVVALNVVTNYDSPARRNAVVLEFEKLALVISIVLLLFTILFGPKLAAFLNFPSYTPFVLLMVALVASVPLTFRGAFLRGKQKFGQASLGNLAAATGKLLFAMALVVAGLNAAGAIGGLIAAQVVASILVTIWAARAGLKRPAGQRLLSLPNFKLLAPELTFGLFVLIGSMVITLQYSLDVIIVKHYFDPHTAGLYAGVASVARIIFFLTASVALVLMSWVKLGAGAGQNRKVLLGSLGLTAAAGLPVVIACVWQPHKITTLLMGNAYQSVADILPKLAVAVFVIAIINVFVSYFLALRRYGMAPALLAGAVITYWLMVTHHATLNAIVQNLLIGSFAMLGLLVVWLASGRFKELA